MPNFFKLNAIKMTREETIRNRIESILSPLITDPNNEELKVTIENTTSEMSKWLANHPAWQYGRPINEEEIIRKYSVGIAQSSLRHLKEVNFNNCLQNIIQHMEQIVIALERACN